MQAFPTVEGSLGILTKNIKVVQADVASANVATITEVEFLAAGVALNDVVYITFTDGVSDLYKIPSPFGALLKYTPA